MSAVPNFILTIVLVGLGLLVGLVHLLDAIERGRNKRIRMASERRDFNKWMGGE